MTIAILTQPVEIKHLQPEIRETLREQQIVLPSSGLRRRGVTVIDEGHA